MATTIEPVEIKTPEEMALLLSNGVKVLCDWGNGRGSFPSQPATVVGVDVSKRAVLIDHWSRLWIGFDSAVKWIRY